MRLEFGDSHDSILAMGSNLGARHKFDAAPFGAGGMFALPIPWAYAQGYNISPLQGLRKAIKV